MRQPVLLAFLLALLCFPGLAACANEPAPDVRITGPISTRELLLGVVRSMVGKNIHVGATAQLTSADALDALASGTANVAIVTRAITLEDKEQYPEIDFHAIPIGMEVIALAVSDDLWRAGLHTINADAVQSIYEQKATNWKQFGGPDEKITFFSSVQGLGIWETFTTWLYGDNRKAPYPKFDKVNSSEDDRDSIEFNNGAIAPLDASLVDGARCHALGIELKGGVVNPTVADVLAKKYPIVHPLFAVVIGDPALNVRVLTEFLTGKEGQALIRKTGAFGLDAVSNASPTPRPTVSLISRPTVPE